MRLRRQGVRWLQGRGVPEVVVLSFSRGVWTRVLVLEENAGAYKAHTDHSFAYRTIQNSPLQRRSREADCRCCSFHPGGRVLPDGRKHGTERDDAPRARRGAERRSEAGRPPAAGAGAANRHGSATAGSAGAEELSCRRVQPEKPEL